MAYPVAWSHQQNMLTKVFILLSTSDIDLRNGPTVLWSYRMKSIKLHLITIQRQAFYLLLILIESILNGNT